MIKYQENDRQPIGSGRLNRPMGLVSLWFALCGLCIPLSLHGDSGLEITRVWMEYREAASFQRISEYFTGRENPGGRLILRSQEDDRTGLYWLVRFRSGETVSRIQSVRLEYIPPDSTTPRIHDFDLPPNASSSLPVLLLGLTGPDWPSPEARPLAFQITIFDKDGNKLARHASFLWEYPPPS